jgi:hypothetical protein
MGKVIDRPAVQRKRRLSNWKNKTNKEKEKRENQPDPVF